MISRTTRFSSVKSTSRPMVELRAFEVTRTR